MELTFYTYPGGSMRILQAKYQSGSAFLDDVLPAEGEDGEKRGRRIRHKTRIALRKGEPVILEVAFPGLPNRVLLRGRVTATDRGDGQATLVEIDGEDRTALDFLMEQASKGSREGVRPRKHDRVPLGLPVDWRVEGSGDVIISSTDDVGIGGLQIRTLSPPPVGTELTLRVALDPPDGEEVAIPGKVVWVRQDEDFQGMGVQFLPTDAQDKRPLRELLRGILDRGEVGGDSSAGRD